ncbi:MAG: carbon starvation CstA family protein, partial [Candidatus Aminicenantales bacterium]
MPSPFYRFAPGLSNREGAAPALTRQAGCAKKLYSVRGLRPPWETRMNVLVLLLAAAAIFVVAGRFYSRYIAKSLGEEAEHPTPAVTINDGRDYVPTKKYVVFA